MSTVAIILAADSGTGFTGPKYLVDVRGTPMLQWVVRSCLEWQVDERIVVLGADAELIVESIDLSGVTVVIDPDWSEGSASPLRAGLDFVSRSGSVTACIIARGDQPDVEASTVEKMLEVAAANFADVILPKYRYSYGWPVLLHHAIWAPLMGSEGSVDLHAVAASYASELEHVWFDQLPPKTYETSDDFLT